jgi:hypothetical protein
MDAPEQLPLPDVYLTVDERYCYELSGSREMSTHLARAGIITGDYIIAFDQYATEEMSWEGIRRLWRLSADNVRPIANGHDRGQHDSY